MPKKLNFDNAIKKAENIASKVEIIMRNKLIIAFFLIVDGVTFLLNPNSSLPEMARGILQIIIFASASILIANLVTKTKDIKTIAISIIIIIVTIIMHIYPDLIAAYMQLLLALFIIYDGLVNLANALHLDWMSKFTIAIANKYNRTLNRKPKNQKKQAQRAKFKEIDDNINIGLEEQGQKMLNPIRNIVSKSSKSSVLYIITASATIILGIILLIFPDVSMMIWGLVFLYTGLSNLIISIKTMGLTKKIKEKKFKEILFDTDKDDKPKQTKKDTPKSK